MRRWPLPLLLVALLAAPGCVTSTRAHPARRGLARRGSGGPQAPRRLPALTTGHGGGAAPLPYARVCGRAFDRRRPRGRPCSRAGPSRTRGPRGIRRDSARPAGSRPQGRRPGTAAPDNAAPARRAPRRQTQAQEGEAADPYARTAPSGTRPRSGSRGHDGAVPRRARRHQPCCGRALPPDLRVTERPS